MLKLLISFAFLAVLGPIIAKTCAPDEVCPIPFTKEMQKGILDYHNDVRSKAKPTAKDMQTMYWDDKLAEMALEYSKKCVFAHNTAAERAFDGYFNVGQNIFGGSARPTSFTDPARSWYNEVKHFKYGKKSKKVVGHYTQVMQGKSARIGCGAAYCPKEKLKYIVTCHYLKGQYNYRTPYKKGKPCKACPGKCNNNTCDCKGKVCMNGGKLKLKTCKCKCKGRTTGDICEKILCDRKEHSKCAQLKNKCSIKNGFTVRNFCVKTCGLCP